MRRVIIAAEFGGHRIPLGTEGYFHQWGSESNVDAGPDTVAVIEKDDGTVFLAYPGQIRFLEPYATTAQLAATPDAEVSATNPPKGWRLAAKGEARAFGYIWFDRDKKVWQMGCNGNVGRAAEGCEPVANPIEVAP